jgi:ParB-like chromosome segregation protein Spo0J
MNDQTKVQPPAPDYDNLQFRSLANIFPLIEDEEFDAFVDMFKKQGLLQPLVLYQGMILEGRNRYRAGQKLGQKFTAKDFTEFTGKNPYEFVIAANVHRRHLTTDQKRTLAVRLIRERPNESDRKIALLLGMSNKNHLNLSQRTRRDIRAICSRMG